MSGYAKNPASSTLVVGAQPLVAAPAPGLSGQGRQVSPAPPRRNFLKAVIDGFYEFIYNYGLALALFGSLAFFFWVLWAVDLSGRGPTP